MLLGFPQLGQQLVSVNSGVGAMRDAGPVETV
jgi:hypothetical protein